MWAIAPDDPYEMVDLMGAFPGKAEEMQAEFALGFRSLGAQMAELAARRRRLRWRGG